MRMTDEQIRELADRFFRAVEEGDVDVIRQCYDKDIIVWHNNDEVEQTGEQNIALLELTFTRLHNRQYRNRRVNIFPGGFVQQHDLHGVRNDGTKVSMPVV